jgi:phage shock protein PspC (stress-responsive transcriptional regulator)
MTTTEPSGGATSPLPPLATPPPAGTRVLRRSADDRIAAGVAGGLGEYFGVDPVLFRVLFATAAFFGGAGVLAYLVAWAVIPEQGTVDAPIDRFIAAMRRRRVPFWLVAASAGLCLWAVAFSWWAPGRFFPILAVVLVLIAIFGRRGRLGRVSAEAAPPAAAGPAESGDAATVSLQKASGGTAGQPTRPPWLGETRQWIAESKAASRERRRRALPLKLVAVGLLLPAIGILAAVDAANGIAIPVYFWVVFGVTLGVMLVGLVLRRTPWSLTPLLVLAVVGLVGFGNTDASMHDGTGRREWTPTSAAALRNEYRLAFGEGVMDLGRVGTLPSARTVDVTMAAGHVRLLVPRSMNVTITSDVHAGTIEIDGGKGVGNPEYDGWGVNHTELPPAGSTGPALTLDVHLADGLVSIEHTG